MQKQQKQQKTAWKNISAHDLLEVGTKVRLNNKFGVVLASQYGQAVPCGVIGLHILHLTSKQVRVAGNTYKTVTIDEQISPNYSSILVEISE